jgi:hypothetical protein
VFKTGKNKVLFLNARADINLKNISTQTVLRVECFPDGKTKYLNII